jgi:RNA 3'-terminal phosphate cyclase (ATP)
MTRIEDMPAPLVIDGAYGEGGGQILRSALALSVVMQRPVIIENVRRGRPRPGFAAQHLAAVRAFSAICNATVEGDELNSTRIAFYPRHAARHGTYRFDIGKMRKGGSAGSTMLVLQALMPALASTRGASVITVAGGTHLTASPSFDYGRDVWLPALQGMGLAAEVELLRWGWFPVGQGEIRLHLKGRDGATFRPVQRIERDSFRRAWGRAAVSRLPVSIAGRMAVSAQQVLAQMTVSATIETEVHEAACPGAGIFLTVEYGNDRAGFCALGKRGLPAEEVGETAASAALLFHGTTAAVDRHLGDQLVIPAALASGTSRYSVETVTNHLVTMAWLVERFGLATTDIQHHTDGTGLITITPVHTVT